MILHTARQHSTNDINFRSDYHRNYRNYNDEANYYTPPSSLPDTLPFFKLSKAPDTQTSSPLRGYHIPNARRASTFISQDNARFNDKASLPPYLLNSEGIRGPSVRSISLDSSCFELPKIDPISSEQCSKQREYFRSHSCGSISPPPSLPPLSETLSNIFPDVPRIPSLPYENCNPDTVSVLASKCCSTASSPAIGVSNPSDHMRTLPPILLQEPANQGPCTSGSGHKDAMHYDEHASSEANHSQDDERKVFSFVALPGINGKKRPRRKFDEIERLYKCNWPGCSKSYGTLNHLNAHVMMQKHGIKRLPNEFKELRKHWKMRKED